MELLILISNVFCFLGLITLPFELFIFLEIGAILNVIEHIVGRIKGQLKSLNTLYLAVILGIFIALLLGTTGRGVLFFIYICICAENVICYIGGLYLIKKRRSDIIQQYYSIMYYSDKIDFFIQQCSDLINNENKIIESSYKHNVSNKIKNIENKINALCIVNDDLLVNLPNNQKEIFQNYQDVIVEIFAAIERLNISIISNGNTKNELEFLNEQILKLNSIHIRLSPKLFVESVIEKNKLKQ